MSELQNLFWCIFICFSTVRIQATSEGYLPEFAENGLATEDCKCENGHCEKSTSGEYKCVCFPEYGLITPQKCKECGCGRAANCTIRKGFFSNDVECICPQGIKKKADRRCEDPCESNPCQNGGLCKIDYRGMTCECPLPYSGNRCEEECVCENGACIRDSSGGLKCECLPGFGLYRRKCKGCDCGEGANCTFDEGFLFVDKYCKCLNGETRKNERCEDPCTSNPCKNGGICESDGVFFNCSCPTPYYGQLCEKLETSSQTFDTPEFTLEVTQTTEELDNVTRDYQQTTNGQHTVTFDVNETIHETSTSDYKTTHNLTEWSDSTTEQIISSQTSGCDCGIKSIACKFDDNGNKRCLCLRGFSQLGDTCSDCYCGHHSLGCFFDVYGNERCMCDMGYAERNGTCSAICQRDLDCWNGGKCRRMDSSGNAFCACPENFTGDKCEVDATCRNLEEKCRKFHAVCVVLDGKPTCECPPEKSFRLSSGICEKICDWRTCVHGQCEKYGSNFVCRCNNGYTGAKCDTKESFLNRKEIILYVMISSLFIIFILAISMAIAVRCRKRKNGMCR